MDYRCPKCGSRNTHKDRIMGSDTMDRECEDCGHVGWHASFRDDPDVAAEDVGDDDLS